VGLERKGFSPAELKLLRQAYRLLLGGKRNTSQALDAIRETLAEAPSEHVAYLADFIANSQRGILK
jgi:UDP-N-acetylglucosamine acyltransferase